MKKRRPQPSPVEVLFRRGHEWAGWSWADAMRAIDKTQKRKKPDLKTVPVWPRRYARGQKRHAVFLTIEGTELAEGKGEREDYGGLQPMLILGWLALINLDLVVVALPSRSQPNQEHRE